jgi:iron(III) transport system substrate-binding protein
MKLGNLALASLITVQLLAACSSATATVSTLPTTSSGATTEVVTLYSGRTEELVAPLIERFEETSGIDVEVRHGTSPEMAATLLTEGANSPADLFFAQDPASLGSVADLMTPLPESILALVPDSFRDPGGLWVGVTMRSRVLAYNPELVGEDELPSSYRDLVDPQWSGRVGVAPTNGSFVGFVSAIILLEGEDAARAWLQGLAANDPITFDGNAPIAVAVDAGDVAVGLINHYYLRELEAEQGGITAKNHFFSQPDSGSLLMPSGIAMLATARNPAGALALIGSLLTDESQAYFAQTNFEYPVVAGAPTPEGVPPLDSLVSPSLSATDMAGVLDRATDLISEAGLI